MVEFCVSQSKPNTAEGGTGGDEESWTPEMRDARKKYKSIVKRVSGCLLD